MKIFFAILKPYSSVMFTEEHKRLATIDYNNDNDLIEQQQAFLEFYKDNMGRWARFQIESNGYIYAVDSAEIVIVSEEWLEKRSPEFEESK